MAEKFVTSNDHLQMEVVVDSPTLDNSHSTIPEHHHSPSSDHFTEVMLHNVLPSPILTELNDKPSIKELNSSKIANFVNGDSAKTAFQTVVDEMEKNKNIAEFVELKLKTEEMLFGEGISTKDHNLLVPVPSQTSATTHPPASPRPEL